jgi:hypothetical protein
MFENKHKKRMANSARRRDGVALRAARQTCRRTRAAGITEQRRLTEKATLFEERQCSARRIASATGAMANGVSK